MATTVATLQNLSLEWMVRDTPAVIADLVKSTGLLQTALVAPANYGNKHKYKRWNSLPAGTFRNFGSGVVPVSLSKDMESLDLWECVSYLQGDCGEVDAHPGGAQGWYNANIGGVLAGMGNSVSKQIFYGTELQTGSTYYSSQNGFLGLAQYAILNSTFTEIDTDDTYTGAQSSLHVVRWDADTGASVRIYPGANGQLIKSEYLGRQMVVTSTTTNAQYDAYTWKISAFLTLAVPAATASYMVCGFNATDSFTSPQLDYACDYVSQGGAGQIAIYTNLRGLAIIRALKYAKMVVDTANTGINNNVSSWNGIPVMLDTNLVQTEYAALYA
jgi:hypothetical protein